MKLIIVSGAEATCKSAIAHDVSKKLGCTILSKDFIKEALFDKEEHSTWDFAWYERAAKARLFEEISLCVERGVDCVVESNFAGQDRAALRSIIGAETRVIEIHCYASGLTSFRRAVTRNETGKRHAGHHDRRWYPKIFFQALLHSLGVDVGAYRQVALSAAVLNIDTTNYPSIDDGALVQFTRR